MILVIKITEKEFDDFSPDFLNSLDTNISNSLIKKIIIFVNFPYFNLNKLKTIVIQNNGTDVDLLKQVCKIYPNKTIIWANKLAKFDNTLSKLNKVDLIENLVYVNSKFNSKENINSLDALIFNSNSKIEYSDNIIDSIMSKKISLDINVINKKPDINTEKVMLKVLKQSPRRISIKNYETIITKKEIYKLSVIIVSVNYNDYLLVSLSNNIKYFEDITVVTSSDDLVCQKICDIFGVKCIITDRIYEDGASFNKGKAINDGIKSIDNPDWILLLDADIVLTKKIDINDDVDVLYTSDRYICKDYNTYKDWQDGKIEIDKVGKYETNRGLGFFHLFNINSSDINKELPFPELSNDAAWSDLHFRDKFTKKSKIDKSVIHLGPTYKNWKGRKTDAFLSDDLFNELYKKQGKTFTICSYYFNFNDDIRQKNNFIKFLEQFKDYHDKMIVGIVDYGDIDFDIPCESIIIKGDPNNKLWPKEIIINKIVNRISTDYLIWTDGDLIYENLDWLNNIENVVGENDFVQLFEDINYLGDNGEILESHKSIISSSSKNIDKLLKKEYKPGGSWLGKTSILKNNNLFEKMYVGGGDTILVYGLFGVNNGFVLNQIGKGSEEIKDEATKWINKFEEYKVGYLNETVNHLYHGDLKGRNYNDRYKMISSISYQNYNSEETTKFSNEIVEEKVKNQIVVYTCISGSYDNLKEVIEPEKNIEYICFTDQLIESKTWKIKKIPEILNNLEQTKKARCLKILPHLFLQEYETSVWVDGNIQVKRSIKKFINENLKNNFAIAKHPDRICVYQESEAVKKLNKDMSLTVDSQIEFYKELGYPEKNGMVQSGVIIRKHNENHCIEICNAWWKEIIKWSKRDQLSFNYSIYNKNMIIDIFNPSIISSDYFDYWTHKGQKAKLRNDYGTLKNYINGKEV